MGRPKIDDPRSQQIKLNFTLAEYAEIRQRALALGLRPSHYGREALLRGSSGDVPDRSGTNLMSLIYNQLRRLGNNLNQMMRHLHQTGDPVPPDLEPLLKDIRDLINKVGR